MSLKSFIEVYIQDQKQYTKDLPIKKIKSDKVVFPLNNILVHLVNQLLK